MGSVIPRAMPTTTGLPLNELLAGFLGRIPLDVGLGIVLEVARLLERAHAGGHVHGSLSPNAIWASASGEIWLEWHPAKSPVAKSLPPEVRQGEQPTVASDIYALAAVGYELLTGLSISRAWAKAPLIHLQDVASARQFNGTVPADVDEVISQALSRHPADRPQRVEVLARAAEGVVQPGHWEVNLAGMVADAFFAPAIRDLPVTCERAGAAVPRPNPLPIERSPSQAPRLVVAEPLQGLPVELLERESANDVVESPRSALPLVKVMIASAFAAALSLTFCLLVSHLSASEGGLLAPASRSLALAVAPVAPAPAQTEAVVAAATPPAKIERGRAAKRGVVATSHAKRKSAAPSPPAGARGINAR
jgi:hypothetical protein